MTQESEGKIKHLTLRITESQHRRIKTHAAREGTTVKDLMLGCVNRLIDEREQAQQQGQEDKDA